VSALGALLGHQVASRLGASGGIPDLRAMSTSARGVVEDAYGAAVAHIFLVAAPFALLALVAIIAMTEVPLRRTLDLDPATNEPVGASR
jgi:hypothetical protein